MSDHHREKDRHRDAEREKGRDRDRDAGEKGRDRDRDPDRGRDRDRERDAEREKGKDREREKERDAEREKGRNRERDADKDRGRDKERDADWERGRDRDRDRKRVYSRSKSPVDRGRKVSSADKKREGREPDRRADREHESSKKKQASETREEVPNAIHDQLVDFVHDKQSKSQGQSLPFAQANQTEEEELMKKLGIPLGFDTTKGKHIPDAIHSAVKLTTKRQPRQYMNRRGGFNRPLPAETNR